MSNDDDGLPALLVTTGEKFLVGDGLRPENMQDYHFSATAGVQDCRRLVLNTFILA